MVAIRSRSLQRADYLGEYVIDICKAANARVEDRDGVQHGYITRQAFHDIYEHIDAEHRLEGVYREFYGKLR